MPGAKLSMYWNDMTDQEKFQHYQDLGNRLLEQRYRYYFLDEPVLDDWIYDYIERYYKLVAHELKLPDTAVDMVDWDETKPGAKEAAERVNTNTDYHSINEARMKEIWDKIGKPRYVKKSEAK